MAIWAKDFSLFAIPHLKMTKIEVFNPFQKDGYPSVGWLTNSSNQFANFVVLRD